MVNGNRKVHLVPGDDSIISQATTTTHPTTPQLLTMKECTDKKVLQVKMSSDDLYPSSKNNCPGGQRPQQPGESNKITKKVINDPKLLNLGKYKKKLCHFKL